MVVNVGALKANGFELEVWENKGIPNIRIRLADGTPVVETNRLSITGMRNIGKVFETAADLAYDELDRYWHRQHLKLRTK